MQASASETVRQTLEDEIAGGQLAPGDRLEEVTLAERFGVSRTPVREALRMLTASGLIELQRRKGAVVSSLSMERLVELFEVMSELEGVCGRISARRITEDEQKALLAQHEKCGEAARSKDANWYYQENASFHRAIYSATHNQHLADEANKLFVRLQPYRRLQLRMKGRVDQSYAEHDEIVRAICAGDEEHAAQALRDHVSVQGHRFADWAASVKSVVSAR